mgnify:CR=1 FL=1
MIFEPSLYIYQSPVGSDYIRDLYKITTELGSQRRYKKIEKSSDVPTILLYASPWDEVKLYDIVNSHEKLSDLDAFLYNLYKLMRSGTKISEQPYNVRIKRHVTPVYVNELYNQFRMYKKKGIDIQGIVMDNVEIEERCGETLQQQLLCFIQWAGIPVVVKQEVKYGEEKNLVEYK